MQFCSRCEGHGTLLPPWEDDENPICEQCKGSGFEVIEKQKISNAKPKMDWENCRALAKAMKVLIGYDHIEFPQTGGKFVTTSSFEEGKSYSYKYNSPNQCYKSLLSLQRDRLARLSDAEAIAAGLAANDFFN